MSLFYGIVGILIGLRAAGCGLLAASCGLAEMVPEVPILEILRAQEIPRRQMVGRETVSLPLFLFIASHPGRRLSFRTARHPIFRLLFNLVCGPVCRLCFCTIRSFIRIGFRPEVGAMSAAACPLSAVESPPACPVPAHGVHLFCKIYSPGFPSVLLPLFKSLPPVPAPAPFCGKPTAGTG